MAAPRGTRGTYEAAGVDTAAAASGLAGLVGRIRQTWDDAVKLEAGYFASVVEVAGQGIAICTDGIGTKALIAQQLATYDTVGIDCVAMNVNDLICLGARPVTLVDYIAVERADPAMLDALGAGLAEGARRAGISISGGEIAQMADVIKGAEPGLGFDLAGTAIGHVALDRINTGAAVTPGDVVIGIASSGIHSNGLTLARNALFAQGGLDVASRPEGLARTVGEELLQPTEIYVREVLALLDSEIAEQVHALVHVTGDGFLNLTRVASPVGFAIDTLPAPPAIFGLIQRCGDIATPEMYEVFNMGIGFCAVVAPAAAARAMTIIEGEGKQCWRIGTATDDATRGVQLPHQGIVGLPGAGFSTAD